MRTDTLVLWVRPEHMDETVEHLTAMGLSFRHERHGLGPPRYAAQVGNKVLEVYPGGQTMVRLLKDEPGAGP